MNRDEPAPIEDRYRGPASDEPAADTSRLSKEEWCYAAKVFVIATVALSILRGLQLTWEMVSTLRKIGAESFAAQVIALSPHCRLASISVQGAVCLTLVLVVHRRMKTDIPPPSRSDLFLPMFLIVPIVTPIAGTLMCAVSMSPLVIGYGESFGACWNCIRDAFRLSDGLIGILFAATGSLFFAGLSAELARLSTRLRRWPILKCFIALVVTGLVTSIVGAVFSLILLP